MACHRISGKSLVLLASIVVLAGCNTGPAVTGTFDREYTVTGPIRLELSNAAGDVDIQGSSDGKVHIHADLRASGIGFDNPRKRLDDTVAHPPVEQRGDTIRIGKDMSRVHNLSISYTIRVPRDTEVSTNVASGAEIIRDLRGPVKVQAASGSIRVEKIERDAQLTTASGSVSASDIDGDVRVSTGSGAVAVANIKGAVRVSALAGVARVSAPGGRVEADTGSGEVEILGAAKDVKAHAASGRVFVQGNPSASSYWELKTISGPVQFSVPSSANFQLSAEAVTGEIRADIPIVIEEQGKHSLRAHLGSGGGRVEVHTVSGEIRVSASNQ